MTYFLEDTRKKIFLDQILSEYRPNSRVGLFFWSKMQPYFSTEEQQWNNDLEQIGWMIRAIKGDKSFSHEINSLYVYLDDIDVLLKNLLEDHWEAIDLLTDFFRIKQFLWFSHLLSLVLKKLDLKKLDGIEEEWVRSIDFDWISILEVLQPNGNGEYHKTFAFEDLDDAGLRRLRAFKRRLLKKEREYQATKEIIVQRQLKKIEMIIKKKEKQQMLEAIEKIKPTFKYLLMAYYGWGKLEVVFQKARMALETNSCRPQLTSSSKERQILILEGFHPYFNKLWNKRRMEPISLEIEQRQIILYGANMSGKTVVLRTVGFLQALAQFGFYVPAKQFESFFFDHLSILTGDYQNIEEGLSSFASEISRLGKELILSKPTLYLLDEIGKGTNPIEGEALAIAISRYLRIKEESFSIVVSHFPKLILEKGLELYEMKEFHLKKVIQGKMVYEGISIAENFNLPTSIIKEAKEYFRGNIDGKTSPK